MSHNTIEMCKSYYENPQKYKTTAIHKWKSRGVIYPDFEDLYDVYINTMECSHCNKPFKKSIDRCLDHCHETGAFRAIVCHSCNDSSSWLRYDPSVTSEEKAVINKKEYYVKNRETISENAKKRYEKNKDEEKAKAKQRYEEKKEQINLKLKCFFCSTEIIRAGLTRHYKLGRCSMIKPN